VTLGNIQKLGAVNVGVSRSPASYK